jgi:hypothetical protein
MQTLNVGAGRTDEEYKAAEAQRRVDLRADVLTDANYFFVAAGLAAMGSGLLPIQGLIPIRLNFAVGIGAFELFGIYGAALRHLHPLLEYGVAAAWVGLVAVLGLGARKGYRLAFLAGVALYAADMIALAVTFSWLSIGVHGFFVYRWFQGQRALGDLKQTTITSP